MTTRTFIYIVILLSMIACSTAKVKEQKAEKNLKCHSIIPGETWLDTNGKPIQSHGFSVFYKDGTYYWYGENKVYTCTI